jgi:predicted nucleic acid-binding protein
MIVVADASVLVAEVIRERGSTFFRDPILSVVVSEEQWSEKQHELDRRFRLFRERHLMTVDQILQIRQRIQSLLDDNAIEIVPRQSYSHWEATARRRIPRDPNDWPTVALALTLGADILTNDYDFFGCRCPTWTFETLRSELDAGEMLRS